MRLPTVASAAYPNVRRSASGIERGGQNPLEIRQRIGGLAKLRNKERASGQTKTSPIRNKRWNRPATPGPGESGACRRATVRAAMFATTRCSISSRLPASTQARTIASVGIPTETHPSPGRNPGRSARFDSRTKRRRSSPSSTSIARGIAEVDRIATPSHPADHGQAAAAVIFPGAGGAGQSESGRDCAWRLGLDDRPGLEHDSCNLTHPSPATRPASIVDSPTNAATKSSIGCS